MHSPLQYLNLPADRLSSIDRQSGHAAKAAHFADLIRHLDGQLPCWCEHHCLRLSLLHVDALDDRDAKGRGLARARERLRDDVAPAKQQRNRLLLDRGCSSNSISASARSVGSLSPSVLKSPKKSPFVFQRWRRPITAARPYYSIMTDQPAACSRPFVSALCGDVAARRCRRS